MKTAVFGAGYWGVNYIRELAGNLAFVVEPDKERAEYVANHYKVEVFPDLPDNSKFDAAVVCTPPGSHIDVALPMLEKGIQVLIEKPFAASMHDAFRVLKYKDKVMAGHVYLYNPGIEKLKEIAGKEPIDHAYSRRTNDGPIRPWQDAMWDLAAHDISIYNYIFSGTPIAINAFGKTSWRILHLEYIGVDTVIYVSWLGGPKTRVVELVHSASGERTIFDDVKTVLEVSPMRRMLDAFFAGDWDDKCSYDAALNVLKVLEACNGSWVQGHKVC